MRKKRKKYLEDRQKYREADILLFHPSIATNELGEVNSVRDKVRERKMKNIELCFFF